MRYLYALATYFILFLLYAAVSDIQGWHRSSLVTGAIIPALAYWVFKAFANKKDVSDKFVAAAVNQPHEISTSKTVASVISTPNSTTSASEYASAYAVASPPAATVTICSSEAESALDQFLRKEVEEEQQRVQLRRKQEEAERLEELDRVQKQQQLELQREQAEAKKSSIYAVSKKKFNSESKKKSKIESAFNEKVKNES